MHLDNVSSYRWHHVLPSLSNSLLKDDLKDVSSFFVQSLEFHFVLAVMDLQLNRADFLCTKCVF